MTLAKSIRQRLETLIEEGTPLSSAAKRGYAYTYQEHQDADGWLTSAVHAVELVVRNPTSAYRQKCNNLVARSQTGEQRHKRGASQEDVGAMIGVLKNLMKDIDAGLIANITDRVRAEVFDDFLDHAEAYYKQGRKESGVIAGVVFEDTMRRIAEKYSVADSKMDNIITNLVKKEILTDVKAKRARVAADVRTKATHARWDEFDLADVRSCIDVTREIITNHLE